MDSIDEGTLSSTSRPNQRHLLRSRPLAAQQEQLEPSFFCCRFIAIGISVHHQSSRSQPAASPAIRCHRKQEGCFRDQIQCATKMFTLSVKPRACQRLLYVSRSARFLLRLHRARVAQQVSATLWDIWRVNYRPL